MENLDIFKDFEQLNLFGESEEQVLKNSLQDKFIIPPFSVFDAKQSYWQKRKKQWLKLGIKSELGREATTFSMKEWADKAREKGNLEGNNIPSDTSIFDPVLCELAYKWFCIRGGIFLMYLVVAVFVVLLQII